MDNFKTWILSETTMGYNPTVIDGLLAKFQVNKPNPLLGKDIEVTPIEATELNNLADVSAKKMTSAINFNPELKKWYTDYKIWASNYLKVNFTWPTSLIRNGGNIPDVQNHQEQGVVVPDKLYNVLSWITIGKSIRESIRMLGKSGVSDKFRGMAYGTSAKSLQKEISQLVWLVNFYAKY